MEKEIRGLDIDQALARMDKQHRIAVGTEGCVNKFCKELMEMVENVREINSPLTLVTPRVNEIYFEFCIATIVRFCEKYNVEYIVVNDYGVLNRLNNYGYKNIVLGRTLVRSLSYTPWSEYILRDESDNAKDNLQMFNIIHKEKYEFYKKMGIIGFELCYSPKLEEGILKLRNEGFKVFYHSKDIIATLGRTCPISRIYGEEASRCNEKCSKVYKIRLNKVWGANKFMYDEPKAKTRGMVPTYYSIENVVYYKNPSTYIPEVDVVVENVNID